MEEKKNCVNNGGNVPDKNIDDDIGPSPPQDLCTNMEALREW